MTIELLISNEEHHVTVKSTLPTDTLEDVKNVALEVWGKTVIERKDEPAKKNEPPGFAIGTTGSAERASFVEYISSNPDVELRGGQNVESQ